MTSDKMPRALTLVRVGSNDYYVITSGTSTLDEDEDFGVYRLDQTATDKLRKQVRNKGNDEQE